jgi:hypothetical protein
MNPIIQSKTRLIIHAQHVKRDSIFKLLDTREFLGETHRWRLICKVFYETTDKDWKVLPRLSFVLFRKKLSLTYNHFLPSPRRYISGWALVSWIISLHISLFFICSDDEASNGRMKKWEECGWKRSWPTSFHPSEAHYLAPEQFNFYGVRLLISPPTWRTRVSLILWLLPLDLSGMGAPTSSYATAGISLMVSGALKPHHHDKVETPSVGTYNHWLFHFWFIWVTYPCLACLFSTY